MICQGVIFEVILPRNVEKLPFLPDFDACFSEFLPKCANFAFKNSKLIVRIRLGGSSACVSLQVRTQGVLDPKMFAQASTVIEKLVDVCPETGNDTLEATGHEEVHDLDKLKNGISFGTIRQLCKYLDVVHQQKTDEASETSK